VLAANGQSLAEDLPVTTKAELQSHPTAEAAEETEEVLSQTPSRTHGGGDEVDLLFRVVAEGREGVEVDNPPSTVQRVCEKHPT